MLNFGTNKVDQSQKQRNDGAETKDPKQEFRILSIDRVSKLPVVEEIMKLTTHFYGKVKRSNCVFNWSLKKAESTASKVANTTTPMIAKLQGPIEKLDGLLCFGLDYLERKVPAVKLPPNEVYVKTKQYMVTSTEPCMNCASAVMSYGAKKLREVCRVCGGFEPGGFDAPGMEHHDDVQSKHPSAGSTVIPGLKALSATPQAF